MQIPNLACLAALLPAPPLPLAGAFGWDHTLCILWTVNLLAAAFGALFVLRRRLRCVPSDLEDAARIDGCGFWRVCLHVMLPVAGPAIGLLGLFMLVAACDDAVAPLIAAGGQSGGAFSSSLYAFHVSGGGVSMGTGSLGLVMGGVLVLMVPVMGLFCFVRRHFSARPSGAKTGDC